MRHFPVREQVISLNRVLRGYNAYYGVAGNIRGRCRGYIGPWSAAGNACWAAAVVRVRSHGKCSIESSSGIRYCDQSYFFRTGS